jgi:hypothetical protein
MLDPGLLNGSQSARGVYSKALDGGDVRAFDGTDRCDTTAYGIAIDLHGARAAGGYAAAKLGANKAQFIAQCPQQGHVRFDIQFVCAAIHSKTCHDYSPCVECGVCVERD